MIFFVVQYMFYFYFSFVVNHSRNMEFKKLT